MNNSIDCHYSIIGKGPALFLIHGIGAAEDAWRFVVPKLSKHFTVITYDLRGHGKSPVTHKNFNLNDLIMDLERIRELSKFDKGHFVGHSLGGMIAPMYAKKFPEKTLSISLLSTVAGRSNQDTKNLLNVIKNMELNGIEKTLSTLTTRWFTDNFINHPLVKPNGEIEFVPKKIRDESGKIISITVIKGGVDYSESNKSAINQVDGISGATVTADGVTDFLLEDLLRYEKTLDKIRDYGTI